MAEDKTLNEINKRFGITGRKARDIAKKVNSVVASPKPTSKKPATKRPGAKPAPLGTPPAKPKGRRPAPKPKTTKKAPGKMTPQDKAMKKILEERYGKIYG